MKTYLYNSEQQTTVRFKNLIHSQNHDERTIQNINVGKNTHLKKV